MDCWSTAAHHCAWPTASSGWWPPPLLPLPLAMLSLLLHRLTGPKRPRRTLTAGARPSLKGRLASVAVRTPPALAHASPCPRLLLGSSRLACGSPHSHLTEHNHTCGELEKRQLARKQWSKRPYPRFPPLSSEKGGVEKFVGSRFTPGAGVQQL